MAIGTVALAAAAALGALQASALGLLFLRSFGAPPVSGTLERAVHSFAEPTLRRIGRAVVPISPVAGAILHGLDLAAVGLAVYKAFRKAQAGVRVDPCPPCTPLKE